MTNIVQPLQFGLVSPNLSVPTSGFVRVHPNFCMAAQASFGNISFADTTGTFIEVDISGQFSVIPNNISWVMLQGGIAVAGSNVAGTLDGYSVASGDGITGFELVGGKCLEFTAQALTKIAEFNVILNAPVHGTPGAVKIWLKGAGVGAGGSFLFRVFGYWD